MMPVTINSSARKVSPAPLNIWTAAIIASRALISSSSPRNDRPVSASTSGQDAMKLSNSSGAAASMAACFARFGFRRSAVIDRAGGAREVSEDILIVRPSPIGDHGLDEGDFPPFELIAPPAHWHGYFPCPVAFP